MDRRQFISFGVGGAAAALTGCATKGAAGDGIQNVRAESPERQAAKMRALESAQELGPTITGAEDIPARMRLAIGKEFLIHATHEEYWFKDYFAYQPDSREKLLTSAKLVHDAGYAYSFIEDKIDW